MIELRAAELARVLRGEWLAGRMPEDAPAVDVSIDSRTIPPGGVFFALEASRDGHEFVPAAQRAGACAAVVRRGVRTDTPFPQLVVPDPRRALGEWAPEVRARSEVPAIAVTGSAGKTTTCGYLAQLLSPLGTIAAPPGSYNNDLGVPLTILNAPADARALVIEIGTNAPGEVATLAAWTFADFGIVTAIAPAHLEGLGTLAGVAQEKLSLFRALPPEAKAWVAEESRRDAESRGFAVRSFGRGGESSIEPIADGLMRWRFAGEVEDFPWRPRYRHQRDLLAVALAIATELGVSREALLAQISELPEPPLRGEIEPVAGIDLILDCYNASPISVRAAMERLEDEAAAGRRLCLLGTMEELGEEEAHWHRELGRRAGSGSIDRVFLTGRGTEWYREGLREVGREGIALDLSSGGAEQLVDSLLPGDRVLFKASRAERLEDFASRVAALLSDRAARPDAEKGAR